MIALCGLDCDKCPARIATINNDNVLRENTAKTWSESFHASIVAADIQCDGCIATNGKQFYHCKVCEIRNCSLNKGNSTCAECTDYPCKQLDLIFNYDPEAKKRLDALACA